MTKDIKRMASVIKAHHTDWTPPLVPFTRVVPEGPRYRIPSEPVDELAEAVADMEANYPHIADLMLSDY